MGYVSLSAELKKELEITREELEELDALFHELNHVGVTLKYMRLTGEYKWDQKNFNEAKGQVEDFNNTDIIPSLAKAKTLCSAANNIAIRLKKRLQHVRGEENLTKEEKKVIGFLKNIHRSINAQLNIALEIKKLAEKINHNNYTEQLHLILEKDYLLIKHIEILSNYVWAIRQYEFKLEKQEAEFARKA